jgi:hypothetical protein
MLGENDSALKSEVESLVKLKKARENSEVKILKTKSHSRSNGPFLFSGLPRPTASTSMIESSGAICSLKVTWR